jgi:response regulator RpfG family c-di-GMP phosphodiesterase
MEVADDVKPRSMRVSRLAGKMAEAAGLEKREIENIKSAALLYEAGDLQSNLPFFSEVVDFMAAETELSESHLSDRENVMLKSTASLLKEIEPILSNYFHHYVEEAHILDKDLDNIPMGSILIALADIHDRLTFNVSPIQELEEYSSKAGVEKLRGRAFPHVAIYALQEAVSRFDGYEH